MRMLSGNAFYSAVGAGSHRQLQSLLWFVVRDLPYKETPEFLWNLLGIAEPRILET